jgi:hypothetical protein
MEKGNLSLICDGIKPALTWRGFCLVSLPNLDVRGAHVCMIFEQNSRLAAGGVSILYDFCTKGEYMC